MERRDTSNSGTTDIETRLNFRRYWQVIVERRWLVIIGLLVCLLAAGLYVFKAPRIYRAVAIVQIDREAEGSFNARDVLLYAGREQDYLQTRSKNLQSPTLYARMARELELDRLPKYQQEDDIVEALQDQIKVAPVRLTRLVEIRAENEDRKLATNVANTLATTFVQDNLDSRRSKALDALRWMESEALEKEKEVRAADEVLQRYKEKHAMVSLEASQNVTLQALVQAQTDLNRAQSEAISSSQVAGEIARMISEGTPLAVIPEVANNPALRELTVRLADKEAFLQALLTRYKDKWPTVIQTREDIASLKHSIETESRKIYDSIQTRAQLARATDTEMRKIVTQRQSSVLELNRLRIEYDVLQRQADQTKALYSSLLNRMQEMDISAKNSVNNMRIVDYATLPLKPVKPRILLVVALGLVGGLGLGLGLAFFVSYLDDSVKTQEDVENVLRLPFLGYIPNIRANSLAERDRQAHLNPRSASAEGFRTLRAALSLSARADKLRTLAFTSTVPSEGKSLCASNFAIVTAQSGLKTVLVDADLRRPSVHKSFQVHAPVGLADYLQGQVAQIDDIRHPSEVGGLDLICCGAIPSNPSELIGSERMQRFVDDLLSRYDRVILDCPPVSAVSDPLVLAARSDGVVFVTKFNKIRRDHARRAVQRLQDAGIEILGVVLNDIDFEGRDWYYYSYYYYQNQYYTSHYKTEPTSPAAANGGNGEVEPAARKKS